MQPQPKPFNWMLVIIGLCCLGGLCSSAIGGVFFFLSSKDKGGDIADLGYDTQSALRGEAEEAAPIEAAPELPPQPAGQRWVDPAGRYSIVFPDDWEIMNPTPDGLEVAAITGLESETDDFAENVNIVLEAIPTGYSQADYIVGMEAGLATVDNYTVHDRGSWDQKGNPGAWIEYSANFDPTSKSHNYVFVITEPGQAYIVTCSSTDFSFPAWKDELRGVGETFRLE